MKVEVKKGENATCTLEVVIESEKVDESYNKHLKTAARGIVVPGFRKGKAPPRYAEKYMNKNMIKQQVIEEVALPALQDAMVKENLTPLSEPSMEIVQFGQGQDLIIKTSFEVKPEITIEDYTGLEIEQEKGEVTDEDIESTLETMRKNATQYVDIEEDRPLEIGDTALVDFESFLEGKPVEKGSQKNYLMEIKEDMFIPGFIDHIKGMKKGENKEFQIAFPEDYPTELRGKPVDFKFSLIGIKKKIVPELNDDFSKEVSKLDTLQDLREHIRSELAKKVDEQALAGVEEKIREKLIERVNVSLPETLVSFEQQTLLSTMERNFRAQGIRFDDYVKKQNIDINQLKESLRPQATRLGKLEMALEAISRKEALAVDDEEVDSKLREIAGQLRQDFQKLKEMLEKEGRIASLRYDLLKQKTIDFLVKNAQVTYVPPTKEAQEESVREAEEPGAEEPGAEEPGAGEPGAEEPGAEEPGAGEPGAGEPGAGEPGVSESGERSPEPEESGKDKVTAEESVAGEIS